MVFWVYVLKNTVNEKIYIGQTVNLVERIKRHNGLSKTKVSSFTHKNKQNGEWILIFSEVFNDRSGAIKREKELKSYRGRESIKNLNSR